MQENTNKRRGPLKVRLVNSTAADASLDFLFNEGISGAIEIFVARLELEFLKTLRQLGKSRHIARLIDPGTHIIL